jgi:heat shock protein HtpX
VLALDAAFVLVVAALARPWLAPLGAAAAAGLGVAVPPLAGRAALVALAVGGFAWAQLRYARRAALAAVDARPVDAAAAPALHGRVTRLAAGMDVGAPTVAVADARVPNAFTVGGLSGATLVVSTGLLDALDGPELDAVLAHELAHVKNRDAAVVTLAAFLPAVLEADGGGAAGDGPWPVGRTATAVALVAALGALWALGAAVAPAAAPGVGGLLAFLVVVGFTALFGSVALGVVAAPVVAAGRRLSRTREFLADRAAALAVGDPAALATALRTLDERAPAAPSADLRSDPAPVRALCLLPHGFADGGTDAADATGPDGAGDADADADGEDDANGAGGVPLGVRSHPPTTERVARLRDLAAALEAGRGVDVE